MRDKKGEEKHPTLGRVCLFKVEHLPHIPPTVTLQFFVCDATQREALAFAQDMFDDAGEVKR